ncbi:LOW QUALITY PROTEIN: C-C motif chemokine 15 [Dugong dugon]
MKVSVAALSFFILAVSLGSQGRVIQDRELRELLSMDLQHESSILHSLHLPPDCCLSYTRRNIRCVFMEDYFETSSGCSQPGVIFINKRGQRVCANPSSDHVQNCMKQLKGALGKEAGTMKLVKRDPKHHPTSNALVPSTSWDFLSLN